MKEDLLQWHRAAMEAIATIEQVQMRLEMNDLEGEEAPFIEDCSNALEMLSKLPINREAVREAEKVAK